MGRYVDCDENETNLTYNVTNGSYLTRSQTVIRCRLPSSASEDHDNESDAFTASSTAAKSHAQGHLQGHQWPINKSRKHCRNTTFPATTLAPAFTWPPNFTEPAWNYSWKCALGYVGSIGFGCTVSQINDTCVAEVQYAGCNLTHPCVTPVFDACAFNVSGCDSLATGSTCEVGCNPPYRGPNTTLSCPAVNLDPTQELMGLPFESCYLICKDPDPIPFGYMKARSIP